MGKVDKFEDLQIWIMARELVVEVYKITKREEVRSDLRFIGQWRAAAISVMNNIAEGFELFSDRKFANHLDIAKGSCGEVLSMGYVALDLAYVSEQEFQNIQEKCISLSKAIYTLRKYLNTSKP
jgi:four helix bundle protein